MTTLYKFKAYYTDAGVGTAQDPAPTCTVINMADDSKLADAQATTASTNMPGLYSYEYSGADGLDCVAFFATTDTGCDVKQLASYVSEKITTNLNADVAGVETKLDTVDANVDAILADTGTDGVVLKAAGLAADAVTAIQSGLATPTNITAGTIATVTNLTNLPAAPADWLTAAAVKADAVTKLQANLALEATLTAIKGAGWSTETLAAIDVLIDAIKAKTDVIPASPAAAGEYTTAIAAIPTAPLLASGYTAPDNAGIAAIKAKTDLIPASPAAAGEYTAAIGAIPTSPLLAANYVAPDNAGIGAIKTKTDNLPANTATTLASLATSAEVSALSMLGEVVIGTYTVQDILKILAAKMVGKATGGNTATVTYRGVDDTSDVVVETVDNVGNRSTVVITV